MVKVTRDNLKTELAKVAKSCYTPLDKVTAFFKEKFSSDFVKNDPQFKTEEDKLAYCLAASSNHFGGRKPVRKYDIVPVGFGSLNKNNKGKKYRDIVVAWQNKQKKWILRRLRNYSEFIPMLDQLYRNVNLSVYAKTEDADFEGDERAEFESIRPEYLPNFDFDNLKLYTEEDIDDLAVSPSKLNKNDYVIQTDWKKVVCFVKGAYSGEKNGRKWAVYRISSMTGQVEGPNNLVWESIAAWVAPEQLKYGEESVLKLYGPSSVNEENEPSLNVFRVTPKFGKPLEEGED